MSELTAYFVIGAIVGFATFACLALASAWIELRGTPPTLVIPSARQMRRNRAELHLGVIARRK